MFFLSVWLQTELVSMNKSSSFRTNNNLDLNKKKLKQLFSVICASQKGCYNTKKPSTTTQFILNTVNTLSVQVKIKENVYRSGMLCTSKVKYEKKARNERKKLLRNDYKLKMFDFHRHYAIHESNHFISAFII